MVGKEVTPKTFSCHNQKTDLCNQKLFPATTTKNTQRTGMVGKYHLKLRHNQKTDTTAQLEICSSSPRVASVNEVLGCDFFAPMHKYTNTQNTVFLLCEGFLPSQPSFVDLFCQKGDFFGPIHGYTYKMTTFLFVYSFFYL